MIYFPNLLEKVLALKKTAFSVKYIRYSHVDDLFSTLNKHKMINQIKRQKIKCALEC